jgi:hypothetical protein
LQHQYFSAILAAKDGHVCGNSRDCLNIVGKLRLAFGWEAFRVCGPEGLGLLR